MKEEIAKLWIEDLRSDPAQARDALRIEREDGTFAECCLGRLCLLAKVEWEPKDDKLSVHPGRKEFVVAGTRNNSGFLPQIVQEWAGLSTGCGKLPIDYAEGFDLASINDSGATFAQIAAIIELHWKDL